MGDEVDSEEEASYEEEMRVAILVFCFVAASCSSQEAQTRPDHGDCIPLGEALKCSPDFVTLKTCYRCYAFGDASNDAGICCRCCS
jgi:hypothetical protein